MPGLYKLLLSIAFFIFINNLKSQDRQGGGQGRNYGQGGPPKICSITGSVVEDSTAAPVPFASVAALRMPDSTLVGGVLTDEKGRFRLLELPPGGYVIRVTTVGFRDKFQPVGRVNPEKPELSGVLIRLVSATARLREVTISADRPEFINSIDKKVYNVDKSLVATGGTVTDVLQNIPSVSVDIDGKVALRGSENVTILVDGKPSGMLGNDRRAVLQQIPASSVDQIEVITNPSAKYDAEGMAGIINIKTKKDKFQGTNGSVAAGVGTNEKYNMSISGNDRTAKRNIFANGGFRHERRFNYGDGRQVNYLPGQQEYIWENANDGINTSENMNGKAGVDFYLDSENTLGISGGFSSRNDERPETVRYLFFDSSGTAYDSLPRPPFFKNNTSDERNANLDANIDYKHIFTSNKGELTSTIGYSQNEKSEQGFFGNSLIDVDGIPYQSSTNDSKFQTVVAQADLSWPFKNIGKLESGLKSTLRQLRNDQKLSDYASNGEYVINPYFSNVFDYDEQVLAAYSMYSGRFRSFEYNTGLRLEQTLVDVRSDQTDSLYQRDYLNLFPSIFLKYNMKGKQELQVSYSRRINRPDSRQLNPFTDYSDSLNIRRGNPYLNPELINSMELAYAKNWEEASLTASVYYRHTDNLISRYRNIDTATAISVMTTVNFSSS
ncbi:MAG: TonB-dependent receptor domain-containing protein, partial [Bacteroidota bacterium]